MMKRIALAAAVLASTTPLFAQSSRGEAKATIAGKAISIDYGRPSLRGRDMLAQAQIGQAWRMGAGDPTALKTEADLAFGKVKVPKGDYVLTATKLAADEWQLNVLGSKDHAKVADVPLTSEKLAQSVEQFTIELTGKGKTGELRLTWGGQALKTAFTAK